MSGFFSSSIGKKLIMSISGLFLLIFLAVHLIANLFLLIGPDAYNVATHFMDTNPLIQLMQPVLAAGFIIHILYASILTLQNQKARGTKSYAKVNQTESSKWASRNMYILGTIIFVFLAIHIWNFLYEIKIAHSLAEVEVDGVMMHNAYALVTGLFKECLLITLLYVVAGIALGLHLTHGFWASFQSIGFSNDVWRKRLECFGKIYAIVIAVGFAIIPIYLFITGFGS